MLKKPLVSPPARYTSHPFYGQGYLQGLTFSGSFFADQKGIIFKW